MAKNHSKQRDWQECRRYFLDFAHDPEVPDAVEDAETMLALIGKLMARRTITRIEPSVDGGVLRLVIPYSYETLVILANGERYHLHAPDAAVDPHFECVEEDLDHVVEIVTAYDAAGFSSERAWRAIEYQLSLRVSASSEEPEAIAAERLLALARTLRADDRVTGLYPTLLKNSIRLSPFPTGVRRPYVRLAWKSEDVFTVALEGPGHGTRVLQRAPRRHQVADAVLRLLPTEA